MARRSNVVPLFADLPVAVPVTGLVAQVFARYREILDHPRAVLDAARRRVIEQRLADGFTLADLELAFYGCKFSAFHQGENDRGEVYDSITLILRNADNVERFVAIAQRAHARMAAEQARQAQHAAERASDEETHAAFLGFLEKAKAAGLRIRGRR